MSATDTTKQRLHQMINNGRRNIDIARELGVHISTVAYHRTNQCGCRQRLAAQEDSDLERALAASNAQFLTTCDGATYGINFSYHELEKLAHFPRLSTSMADQLTTALRIARNDHKLHEERGTCVMEDHRPQR